LEEKHGKCRGFRGPFRQLRDTIPTPLALEREHHGDDQNHPARIIPNAFVLLSNWRYLEHSILRIIAGWGRCAGDWEDKLAMCNHTWLQAQIVDRLRKRLDMFPGVSRMLP